MHFKSGIGEDGDVWKFTNEYKRATPYNCVNSWSLDFNMQNIIIINPILIRFNFVAILRIVIRLNIDVSIIIIIIEVNKFYFIS